MDSTNGDENRSPWSQWMFENGYRPADEPYVAPEEGISAIELEILALADFVRDNDPNNISTENALEAAPTSQQEPALSGQQNSHQSTDAVNQPLVAPPSPQTQADESTQGFSFSAVENRDRTTTPSQEGGDDADEGDRSLFGESPRQLQAMDAPEDELDETERAPVNTFEEDPYNATPQRDIEPDYAPAATLGNLTTPVQDTPLIDGDWGLTAALPQAGADLDINSFFDDDVLQNARRIQNALHGSFEPSNAPMQPATQTPATQDVQPQMNSPTGLATLSVPPSNAPFVRNPQTGQVPRPGLQWFGTGAGGQPVNFQGPYRQGQQQHFGAGNSPLSTPASSHPSGVSSTASTPSRQTNPAAQSAGSRIMTEGERRREAREIGKRMAPLQPRPITPASKGTPGPKPNKKRTKPSNFDTPTSETLSPASIGAMQSFATHPPAQQQPPQRYVDHEWQRSFEHTGSMTAPARPMGTAPMMTSNTQAVRPAIHSRASIHTNADGEDAYASSSSSVSARTGEKRKANSEPKGEAIKRARMLSGMVDDTVRNVQQRLDYFKRTSMPADFAANAASAIERIVDLKDAEDFLRGASRQTKYYKLRIPDGTDNEQQVQGELLEDIRKKMVANIQEAPMPAPNEHKYHEEYDYDHDNQHKDLMRKIVNHQNHLYAASKVRILIEAVKDVHKRGLKMPQLNAAKFDTQAKIIDPYLPKDAETQSCTKKVDQSLTCIERLVKIAEAIRVNKWLANDIMRGSGGDDWTVLICNPAQALELKATNWESNHKKKLEKNGKSKTAVQSLTHPGEQQATQQATQPIQPQSTQPHAQHATQPIQPQYTQLHTQQAMQPIQPQYTQPHAQHATQPSQPQATRPRTQQAAQRRVYTGLPPGVNAVVIDSDYED
ncbi:hypothetical protein PRZ48_014023 [Zasmidium cellare]|uniref:Uncharacterized protein n=1 Tax=Zasmidium cellare TaxID=395010 RepID=A0ABR0DZR2_ZASCE|nr:hypothetical protein PRZ48_014023 [Zasmidium cellare]